MHIINTYHCLILAFIVAYLLCHCTLNIHSDNNCHKTMIPIKFTVKIQKIWIPNIINSVITIVKLIVQYSNVSKRCRWNDTVDPDQHVHIGTVSTRPAFKAQTVLPQYRMLSVIYISDKNNVYFFFQIITELYWKQLLKLMSWSYHRN